MNVEGRPLRRVPSVVGLPFSIARQEAAASGVALANPDPDGPAVAPLAWPADPVVVAQDPGVGAAVREWDSVRVWLQGGPDAPALLRRDPLDEDSAHAVPDPAERGLDLRTDEESPEPASTTRP